MKTNKIDKTASAIPSPLISSNFGLLTAPSLRVPVTRENRAYLKFLRQSEQAAWLEADELLGMKPSAPLAPTATSQPCVFDCLFQAAQRQLCRTTPAPCALPACS